MAILSELDQARYGLATGKHFAAYCDNKDCNRLIPVGELYVVLKWQQRTDGKTFLGPIPKKIRCKDCQERLHPRPLKKEHHDKPKANKALCSAIMKIFTKQPKSLYPTELIISKLKRRKKFSKTKKSEFNRALRALKKDKSLLFKDQYWRYANKVRTVRK